MMLQSRQLVVTPKRYSDLYIERKTISVKLRDYDYSVYQTSFWIIKKPYTPGGHSGTTG